MGAGGLWVRTAHTALSGALALGLFLHRTDLQKQEERGELLQPLIFVLLVLCSVLLYFKVSLMDPGFVKSEEEVEAGNSEEQSMVIPQVPINIKMRRCGYCMVKQPMRARHCQLCQHCVRRYDHHCPWIENCVGEKNHPLFVAYLSVQLVVLLWGGHAACLRSGHFRRSCRKYQLKIKQLKQGWTEIMFQREKQKEGDGLTPQYLLILTLQQGRNLIVIAQT